MQEFTFTNDSVDFWLGTLDALLLFHFGWTYYRFCIRQGFRLDFWHFSVLTGGVLPVLVNYFFAGAMENRSAVGANLTNVQTSLAQAFTIQVVGYICMDAGFYVYNARHTNRTTVPVLPADRWVIAIAMRFRDFINSDQLLYTYTAFTFLGGAALLAVAFRGSPGLNLRSIVFGDPTLRPIYNVIFVASGPLLLGAIWAKYLGGRKRVALLVALLMLMLEVLSGTRGPVIVPMGTLLSVYAVVRGRKVSLQAIMVVMALLLVFAVGVQYLRVTSDRSASAVSALTDLAYGNEYSDTRDFAWLLAKWDGSFLWGKTYLAGIVAILPRSFFLTELRETWSFSFYQSTLTHLDTNVHPGLRPGRYGELYMNFGYPAVILAGFLTGYYCRLIDYWIKVRNLAGIHEIVTDFSIAIAFNLFEPVYHSANTWTVYMLFFFLSSAAVHKMMRARSPVVATPAFQG